MMTIAATCMAFTSMTASVFGEKATNSDSIPCYCCHSDQGRKMLSATHKGRLQSRIEVDPKHIRLTYSLLFIA